MFPSSKTQTYNICSRAELDCSMFENHSKVSFTPWYQILSAWYEIECLFVEIEDLLCLLWELNADKKDEKNVNKRNKWCWWILWKEIKLPCANSCHLFFLWMGMLKVFHAAYCHRANRMGVWLISHDNFIKYIELLVSVLVCKWPILVKCDKSWGIQGRHPQN